jgi:hypothetical protein
MCNKITRGLIKVREEPFSNEILNFRLVSVEVFEREVLCEHSAMESPDIVVG